MPPAPRKTGPHRNREIDVLCARAYLAEAARRRHHLMNRDFYWTLLQCAGNARRRAASMAQPRPHQQMPLFT